MGQLLLAELHHFAREIYPAALFSTSGLAQPRANEHKSVAPPPDQPLGASRRETGLQTQKAPLASPVTSKQMRFLLGILNIQRETTTPNASTPDQEMNAILQRVSLLFYMPPRDRKHL